MRKAISGVLTAIVTPFTAEGRLTCRRYASRCSASSPQATVFSAAAPTASFCPQ